MIANRIFVMEPASFGYNAETAVSNAFQTRPEAREERVRAAALRQFGEFVQVLESENILVDVLEDDRDEVRKDAIFLNNWFSTHPDGTLITYPMLSPMRRRERDVRHLDYIIDNYRVQMQMTLEHYESDGMFLEGTGSMVIDHEYGVVYGCLSPRTHPIPFLRFCRLTGFTPVLFHATDESGIPVYHTNVMMALGQGFVVINRAAVPEEDWRILRYYFTQTRKEIIEIAHDQMAAFLGNLIYIHDQDGQPCIVLSSGAEAVLRIDQRRSLEKYGRLIHSDLSVIEQAGGGSARCMIAENYLLKRGDGRE